MDSYVSYRATNVKNFHLSFLTYWLHGRLLWIRRRLGCCSVAESCDEYPNQSCYRLKWSAPCFRKSLKRSGLTLMQEHLLVLKGCALDARSGNRRTHWGQPLTSLRASAVRSILILILFASSLKLVARGIET